MTDDTVLQSTDDNSETTSAHSSQHTVQQTNQIADKVLEFLSNASNETLIACAVGASAVLYMVLGRIGLLLIGIIVGVALHATWERQDGDSRNPPNEKKRRQEVGLDVVRRLLDWKDIRLPEARDELDTKTEIALEVASRKELNFTDYPPETASALANLTEAVIRDYVKFWYNPILPGEDSFPFSAKQTLTGFILAFCNHQARKRPADVLLNFLTNATSIFIVFLNELSKALMAQEVLDLDPAEALQLYLDREPDSNLASIANSTEQERKLLATADDFLQGFLDPKTYNCEPARLFLRQVFAGVVLQSVLNSISQPEWINGWIVYLLEEGEPELISAIDAGVEGAAAKVTDATKTTASAVQSTAIDLSQEVSERRTEGDRQNQGSDARSNRLSIAGDAMQAAMEEAKRLTDMIEAQNETTSASIEDLSSSALTTDVQVTPASSQDEITEAGSSADLVPAAVPDITKSSDVEASSPQQFTSFDQITPAYRPIPESKPVPPLTLHKARITIFDDAQPGDKSVLKSKPQTEYLLQIEPASALHSGWMVPRKHADIEPLHEYLYKISNVSGAPSFARKYQYLPTHKGKTKDTYRQDLEKYFHDALSYEPLAESEGMKRFLDKDQGFQKSGGSKNPLAFAAPVGDAFQTVGKGVLGGFSTATKGVAAGGQAVFDGVGGLFGGAKKAPTSPRLPQRPNSLQSSQIDISSETARSSQEVSRPRPGVAENTKHAGNPPAGLGVNESDNVASQVQQSFEIPPALPPRQDMDSERRKEASLLTSEISEDEGMGALPTPPASVRESIASLTQSEVPRVRRSEDDQASVARFDPASERSRFAHNVPSVLDDQESESLHDRPRHREYSPLDEQETRVAIELMFAAINELYTLSSAWNIRRTLLNAAKNYLLRPGNPSLLSIRELLQSNILDSNTSDKAIADHIRKMRENSMPTEAEMASWPPALNAQEKDKLRAKARKLLVTKGMPQALTSVMGTAASGEALGRVFDALQVERVNRGFAFALMLQAIRAVIS